MTISLLYRNLTNPRTLCTITLIMHPSAQKCKMGGKDKLKKCMLEVARVEEDCPSVLRGWKAWGGGRTERINEMGWNERP